MHDRSQVFEADLERLNQVFERNFRFAMAEKEAQMVLLASMVAADPEVQRLFYAGKRMVEAEGGGPGGVQTAALRAALYQRVAPAWHSMQLQYNLRQLHFHLGPGSLSYLRVHQPDRFGDRMDGLRFIIEDTNATQTVHSGLETGRIYSGLRGVVPVWYEPEPGRREYVGALEAGSALEPLVNEVQHYFESGFAILLKRAHLDNAVWNGFKPEQGGQSACNCYLEATSDPVMETWLAQDLISPLSSTPRSRLLTWEQKHYYLVRFPLQDYQSKVRGTDPVGEAVGWRDVTDLVLAQETRQWRIYLLLSVSFVLTLALLLLLMFRLRNALQNQIDLATAQLGVANDQLDTLLRCSPVVAYQVPVPGSSPNYIGPNIEQLLGYTPAEVIGDPDWWFEHIHPADRAGVISTLEWRHWPADGITRRYRMRHKDQNWHWIEDRCRVTRDEGNQASLNGALIDITQQQQTEQALRDSEQRLVRAQAVGKVGSWEYHDDAELSLSWSLETYRIFGIAPEIQPTYALFLDCVHPDDRDKVNQAWQAALEGAPYDIEHRILVNGEVRWIREVAELQHDAEGVLRAAGVMQDITEQKERELELRRLASTDMLTGLPNRRYFMKRLLQELARARRHGTPCSLLMLDLDHFKQINDHFGHAAGDQVLQAFAEVAERALRESDIVARLGGEEFSALLAATDLEGGRIFAERLREAVSAIRLDNLPELRVSISIGVTLIEPTDEHGDAILSRADKALYRAKSGGRNRVEVAPTETHPGYGT